MNGEPPDIFMVVRIENGRESRPKGRASVTNEKLGAFTNTYPSCPTKFDFTTDELNQQLLARAHHVCH